MVESGWILYLLLAVMVYAFWRATRGLSSYDLLERGAEEHHQVQRVAAKHPRGGSWRQHQQWMKQEKAKPRRRAQRS